MCPLPDYIYYKYTCRENPEQHKDHMRWILSFVLLFSLTSVQGESRTWTDTKGRTMQAELIGKTPDTVTIRRSDGMEFTVPITTFSTADRGYVVQWSPPVLEVPDIKDAIYIISAGETTGSGFLMQDMGQVYLYTNQHVIQGFGQHEIRAANANGRPIQLGNLQVVHHLDIARIHVDVPGGLKFADNVDMDEVISTYGNSGGAGVLTINKGKVAGLSGDLVEVTAAIIPGNSGGPILNEDKEVLGLATFISTQDELQKQDWKVKGTRYAETRRYGLRVKPDLPWQPVQWQDYQKQGKAVSQLVEDIETWFTVHYAILIDPSSELDDKKYDSSLLRDVIKEQNENARRFNAKIGSRVNPSELARMNRYENRKLGERMEANLKDLERHIAHFRSANSDISMSYFTDQVKDVEQWVKNLKEWVDTEMGNSRTFFRYY